MGRAAPTGITAMAATVLRLTTDPRDRPRRITATGPVALTTRVLATRTPMVEQLPAPPTPPMAPCTPAAADTATSQDRPITMGPARPPPEERPITAAPVQANTTPAEPRPAANTGTPAAAAAGRMTTAPRRGQRVRGAGAARVGPVAFTAGANQVGTRQQEMKIGGMQMSAL